MFHVPRENRETVKTLKSHPSSCKLLAQANTHAAVSLLLNYLSEAVMQVQTIAIPSF